VCFQYFAREAAGATGTRLSLRPLFFWARNFVQQLGRYQRRGNADVCLKKIEWEALHYPRRPGLAAFAKATAA
jgi:hypothetical protein